VRGKSDTSGAPGRKSKRGGRSGSLGGILAAIGLASDLLYALGAGGAGDRLRASAGYARRRQVTGMLYLLLAVVALVGGRRHAT
jgi:hypothetical protein